MHQTNSPQPVQWSVGLSNGENAHEGVGDFGFVPGELSPWQKLTEHMARNGLEITSICLKSGDGRTFSVPSSGRNPKFRMFSEAPKPIDYGFFRTAAQDVMGGRAIEDPDRYTVISAIYPGFETQLWVNERTLNAWVVTR